MKRFIKEFKTRIRFFFYGANLKLAIHDPNKDAKIENCKLWLNGIILDFSNYKEEGIGKLSINDNCICTS